MDKLKVLKIAIAVTLIVLLGFIFAAYSVSKPYELLSKSIQIMSIDNNMVMKGALQINNHPDSEQYVQNIIIRSIAINQLLEKIDISAPVLFNSAKIDETKRYLADLRKIIDSNKMLLKKI